MISLDTNLLIYAHRADALQHMAARHAIERALDDPRGCGISLPCLAEFWSVVTHPAAIGGPATPALARAFIHSLVDQRELHVWLPNQGFGERFVQLAAALSVAGPRVFDLQIGLIAIENGAEEIWTHDRNFLRLRGLRIHDPLA